MGEFVKVASTSELAPGQARLVNIKGKEIALFNIEGNFFALENACTHEEGPLAEGDIEGHEVTCPWHGARFDIRTGEVLCAPAYEDAARYNVRVIGTDIEVGFSDVYRGPLGCLRAGRVIIEFGDASDE